MVASKSNGSSPSTYSPSIGSNEMEDMYFFKSQQHFIRQKISALSNASKLSPVISGSSMMRNQIFSSFLSECFPSNSECASDINLTRFILSGLSLLPQKSSMLEMALSALSCIFLGKIRHNEPLFQHGLQLYNRGIRHMSNILGGKMYNDDMVYTSVVFQQIQVGSLLSLLSFLETLDYISRESRLTIVPTHLENGSLMSMDYVQS